jgi:tetratricopeptide (TPR) repeat protein
MAKLNSKSLQLAATTPDLWLYNPWVDAIVGCSAWSAPLLLVAYLSIATNTLHWSVAFYGLALLFNYPHYMATIYRAYHRAEDFHKYRLFTVHLTLLIAVTAIVCHFLYRALPIVFTLYLTWSPWHYSGQNYGILLMFARRAGAQPSTLQRRALYTAFLLSYAILFLNFHTGASLDPFFLSLNIPSNVSMPLQIGLGISFLVCCGYGLSGLWTVGWRRLLPSLTLLSTQCVWFLVPTLLALAKGWQVPQSRYSTGVLAIMHSAQYLWITSYYARREANAEGRQNWRVLVYFAVLVTGGIALFIPGPWIASHLFHFDFTRSFLIFTALVNIHHFLLDGAIWKLRDGRIASLLLNSRARFADAATDAQRTLTGTLRWLAGPSIAAHRLRVTAVIALLAWGTIDQFRYYFALRSDSLPLLQRAAALSAYDAALETELGQKELDAGKPDLAMAAWTRGMQANPIDPAPRNAMLQFLTSQKRFQEAYDLTRIALERSPRDAQLLVNQGLLSMQLGHPDEAVQSWQKAITADPKQLDAHLYLAAELDRQGKPGEAALQYGTALQLVARQSSAMRPAAAKVIGVALKMADCHARANHLPQALRSYELARKLAAQTSEGKLESFASMSEALVHAKSGKPDQALPLFQRALRLDASLNDRHSEAVDWYTYAVFLRDTGFPIRLAFAGLLKSEATIKADPTSPKAKLLAKSIQECEKSLGREATAIRHNPSPWQQQALTVSGAGTKVQINP